MNKYENLTCIIKTGIKDICPKNCKSVLSSVRNLNQQNRTVCIADEKMNAFLEGKNTFNVAISAFYQADSQILERFIQERKENKELVSYYLSISPPELVSDIVESLSNDVIFDIFKESYENFTHYKEEYKTGKKRKSFFEIKGNQYWQRVSFHKICQFIVFIIKEKKEYSLAAQFLILLPEAILKDLEEYTGLTQNEIKNLYLGLSENIYELPINNPQIYPYLLKIMEDEPDIYFVLLTMEGLVKRQENILNITEKLISYYQQNGFGLTIQHIYSELNGLDVELTSEILNQLRQRDIITDSQKEMLDLVFKRGSIDFLKNIKDDILNW